MGGAESEGEVGPEGLSRAFSLVLKKDWIERGLS